MNFINIAGHLGADPEVRFTSSGKKVTTLRVATKARKGGEDVTIWWRVTVWGETFDKMISFLKKGSPIVAFGELQPPQIFNDREGKPQISMELSASLLQFSPFGKGEGGSSSSSGHQAQAAPFNPMNEGAPMNPYAKPAPAMSMPSGPSGQMSGQTYDDEVPF